MEDKREAGRMDSSQKLENKKLGDALLNDDREAIGSYLEKLRSVVEWEARKCSLDDPEGIASQVIMETLDKIPNVNWQNISSPKGYLFIMCKRAVINKARKRVTRPSTLTTKEIADFEGIPSLAESKDSKEELGGWSVKWIMDKVWLKPSSTKRPKHKVVQKLADYVYSYLPFWKSVGVEKIIKGEEALAWQEVATLVNPVERRRLKKHIYGFRPVDIKSEEGVSLEAVSRTIRTCLSKLKWDRKRVNDVRMAALYVALSDIYKEVARKKYRIHERRIVDYPTDGDEAFIHAFHRAIVNDPRTTAHFRRLPEDATREVLGLVIIDSLLEMRSFWGEIEGEYGIRKSIV